MALPHENDHNVYILGAGFSVAAGLPLVSQFLSRMRDASSYLEDHGRSREAGAIQRVLEFREAAASAAYRTPIDVDNIEELFSLASADGGTKLHQDMSLAIGATLDHSREVSKSYEQTGQVVIKTSLLADSPLSALDWTAATGNTGFANDRTVFHVPIHHVYVAAMLGLLGEPRPRARNTFLSFNYDLVLEESLRAASQTVDYGIGAKSLTASVPWVTPGSGVRVLKLHGSLNWAFPGRRGQHLTAYDDYESLQSQGLVPLVIPPTWRKDFGYSQLDQVWTAAVDALRTATRIVVVGFSIPENDLHFRYLLAAGLRKNISLRQIEFVDPDIERVQYRAATVLRKDLVRLGMLTFHPRTADSFVDRSFLKTIGRPAEVTLSNSSGSSPISLSIPSWS